MAIARELHIPKVIVPLFPAHFSALGMLGADERHDFIRTFYADLGAVDFRQLERTVEEMAAESSSALAKRKGVEHRIHLDLRYVGQEFTLSVPVTERQIKAEDRRAIRTAFDRLYDQRYAHHSPEEPVEIVNIRLAVIGKRAKMKLPRLPENRRAKAFRKMEAYLGDPARPVSCPVYRREELGAGARIAGPALVREHGTTTVLFKGDVCSVARTGELLISVRGAA
jgi:N-methylhydantoinase A